MTVEFPQGDGRPDCPQCRGRGVVEVPTPEFPVGVTQPCSCVWVRDIVRNMERGWPGLMAADPIPKSPLRAFTKKNAWVTSPKPLFKSHCKHVAAREQASWNFLVVTDADLMNAWLSPSLKIRDADIYNMREQAQVRDFIALVDMVEPPDLLIIVLGTKVARNEAMPEVLAEVLQTRAHLSRPTWVVDQPGYPFVSGHIAYSQAMEDLMSEPEWTRVVLELAPEVGKPSPASKKAPKQPPPPREAPTYVSPKETPGMPLLTPGAQKTKSLLGDEDTSAKKTKWRPKK